MSNDRRVADRLQQRLAALAEVQSAAVGRLPDEMVQRIGELRQRATARLEHGSEFTVVALAGATGSGKSSMFNAIAGRELARTGVRRPTTSTAQAVVFVDDPNADPASGLLDWIAVPARQVIHDADLAGLVLLDLPDHDSVEATHRAEVDRLAKVVDVFCWVVDPQKYADAALHRGYLRSLSSHAAVTVVVMNQIDTLPAEARDATLADLRRLLTDAGLNDGRDGVRVLATSARSGEGVEALRRELSARVHERRALVARIDADVDWLGQHLQQGVADVRVGKVGAAEREQLIDAIAAAAGVETVAEAVGARHRRASSAVAGWPPTRWLGKLRPDPVRRLGLGKRSSGDRATVTVPSRTSIAPPSPMAQANIDAALREVINGASGSLPPLWRERLGHLARQRRVDLVDSIDRAVANTQLPDRRPRWWALAALVQRLATLAMVVGLVWLLILGVIGWFQLPEVTTPKLGRVPLPTVLAGGGAILGLAVAALARLIARWGGARRARVTRHRLRAAVGRVTEETFIDPLQRELAAMSDLAAKVRALAPRR